MDIVLPQKDNTQPRKRQMETIAEGTVQHFEHLIALYFHTE